MCRKMVILKTILNSFQNLKFSFQNIIEFATKKKMDFFANLWNVAKKQKDYSCPTFGNFKVKEILIPIF
jgi:hypothetical protein